MKHEHHVGCLHREVRYCERCDVCFCPACNREWGPSQTWWSPWYHTTYQQPFYNTWTASSSAGTVGTIGHSECGKS
jgi:hypothetical protein